MSAPWPRVPLGAWVEVGVRYLERTFAPSFGAFSSGADALVGGLGALLAAPPAWLLIAAVAAALWRLSGLRTSLLCALALLLVVNLGLWDAFILTLTLVLAAEALVVLLGVPLGILMALSDAAQRALTPLLDAMQTMPSFVYLIPAVTFFGLGLVPGVVATVVFALPPLVRLTNLGLRQVPKDIVEAAEAFGGTRWQRLRKVELPAARPMLLAGVNQSIMLSLSMVVIAALIGAGGLGQEVIRGMNTLDIALGFEAGLAIVIMAVVLDRLTQPRRHPRGQLFSGRSARRAWGGRGTKPEAP
ncbi:ABC transporter permease [Truepera radiovictrix]|uniref:Binding-protein-dependent transport systems inner membrane component n=1 Tax=Truepera radiovictrix (strain DSM 17093 / CIP 108686 / LMG 22925 / RQ-24) TaxID=649638 RepID=D7CQ72_TRURR|nr:ABC transporter permease subunit [Truepera radiovictrix]ADI14856.1 binding-protein-dependent transport systems inner membrane component [Truepera radiovictrix DSM 17093]WMT56593.1 ABC transporter permease subunit [Truepera radiovictrix]